MQISELRCAGCGARDLLSVAPGAEPEETDLFLLVRGTPAQAWCLPCWLKRHGIRSVAVVSVGGRRRRKPGENPLR